MPAFHEIENTIRALFEGYELAQAEGLDPNEQAAYEAQLDALLDELADAEAAKIDGVYFYITEQEARAEQIQDTIRALQNRKKTVLNRVDSLKEHILVVMHAHGLRKIEGNTVTAFTRQLKDLNINERAVPRRFKVQDFIYAETLNKKAIEAALKAGEQVDGCTLGTKLSLNLRRA